MSDQSLEQALQAADNPVDMFRAAGGQVDFPNVAREYTNWIEEQRSWRESCCLADLTHHQMDQVITGPDAMDLFERLCVNSVEDFEVGKAKQSVMCNPDGKLIGDGILQRVGEEEFVLSGSPSPANWIAFHIDTRDYDADQHIYDMSAVSDEDPHFYTFQVQGPNALDVMEAATDDPLPEIPFFNFDMLSIAGHEVRALRHGMAGEAGFELQGPFEEGDAVKQALLDAGEEYDIRRLGTRSYRSLPVLIGWVDVYVKALYDGDGIMQEYREWLDADSFEGSLSIVGSFDSDDITDYYLSPAAAGLGRTVNFDHDFIGREALEAEMEDPDRTLVTLVWDDDDAVDIYASLFREGDSYKFMNLPRARMRGHYDEVRADGEMVGLSRHPGYTYNERAMLSLCSIDADYAEPGTEVTLLWGESGDSPNPTIEDHVQKEVRATVAPTPYIEDRRKGDW